MTPSDQPGKSSHSASTPDHPSDFGPPPVGVDDLNRNIEVKVRVDSLQSVRRAVGEIPHRGPERLRQRDTYLHCGRGRLKLRQTNDAPVQLIWYERSDRSETRASDYKIVEIADREAVEAFQDFHGVRVVVDKIRDVYFYENVRIHLDEVERLGTFVELESVIGPNCGETLAARRLEFLLDALPLQRSEFCSVSYADMRLARQADR